MLEIIWPFIINILIWFFEQNIILKTVKQKIALQVNLGSLHAAVEKSTYVQPSRNNR